MQSRCSPADCNTAKRPVIKLISVTAIAALLLFPRNGSDLYLDRRPATPSGDHEALSDQLPEALIGAQKRVWRHRRDFSGSSLLPA
jgi:hypothetical protein